MLWSIRYVNNILVLIPYCAYITRKNVVIWWRHHAIVRTNKVVHAGETPRWCNWKYNSNQSQNSTEQYSIFTFSTTTHPVKTRKQKRQKTPKKQKQNKNKENKTKFDDYATFAVSGSKGGINNDNDDNSNWCYGSNQHLDVGIIHIHL